MAQSVKKPKIYTSHPDLMREMGDFNTWDIDGAVMNDWNKLNGGFDSVYSIEDSLNLAGLNPYKNGLIDPDQMLMTGESSEGRFYYPQLYGRNSIDYVAFLGHNFRRAGVLPLLGKVEANETSDNTNYWYFENPAGRMEEIVNYNLNLYGDGELTIDYDGFSIVGLNPYIFQYLKIGLKSNYEVAMGGGGTGFYYQYSAPPVCGCISYGSIYDFPLTANMEISQSVENNNIKKHTSITGKSISNSMETPNLWAANRSMYAIDDISTLNLTDNYNLGIEAWTLNRQEGIEEIYGGQYLDGGFTHNTGYRSGKRRWDLRFTQMSDRQIGGINQKISLYHELDQSEIYDSGDFSSFDLGGGEQGIFNMGDAYGGTNQATYNQPNVQGVGFLNVVYNQTLGGKCPFIFQIDGNNNNPDQFCLAKLDMKSLKLRQLTSNTYDVQIRIYEI